MYKRQVFLAYDDTECIINNVPYVTQENVLPTGCESACAVMVLQYNGFDIEPVSYTHLDVYKRQGRGFNKESESENHRMEELLFHQEKRKVRCV